MNFQFVCNVLKLRVCISSSTPSNAHRTIAPAGFEFNSTICKVNEFIDGTSFQCPLVYPVSSHLQRDKCERQTKRMRKRACYRHRSLPCRRSFNIQSRPLFFGLDFSVFFCQISRMSDCLSITFSLSLSNQLKKNRLCTADFCVSG